MEDDGCVGNGEDVALDNLDLVNDLVALLPHLGLEGLAGEDVLGEAHLDRLDAGGVRIAVRKQDVLGRDAKRAQTVQNGHVKATHLSKRGVEVERVAVA